MASLVVSFPLLQPRAAASSTICCDTATLNQQKFGRKGIKFSESGEVELRVRNGSSLKLQISNGHVTSYRPKVYWRDDGYEEVLHTVAGGSRGGIALVVNEAVSEPNSKIITTTTTNTSEWTVKEVDSDSSDALQVELSCTKGSLDITYVVSLYPLSMATAVIVKNNGRKAVDITSAILSHLKLKRRSGAGVQGLRGCSYCTHPPPPSPFEILTPSEAIKSEDDPGFFSSFGWEPEKKPGEWSVQDVPITVLKHKLSRLYAAPPPQRSNLYHRTAPSKYETIDQDRQLFFRVIRMGGFDEIYLSGPGSYSDKFGKDYFICTGPATMLVPVTLNPGAEWRGAQVIEHDNL